MNDKTEISECCFECANLMFTEMLICNPFTFACAPSGEFVLRCDFANTKLCSMTSDSYTHPWYEWGEPQWISAFHPLWCKPDPRIPEKR